MTMYVNCLRKPPRSFIPSESLDAQYLRLENCFSFRSNAAAQSCHEQNFQRLAKSGDCQIDEFDKHDSQIEQNIESLQAKIAHLSWMLNSIRNIPEDDDEPPLTETVGSSKSGPLYYSLHVLVETVSKLKEEVQLRLRRLIQEAKLFRETFIAERKCLLDNYQKCLNRLQTLSVEYRTAVSSSQTNGDSTAIYMTRDGICRLHVDYYAQVCEAQLLQGAYFGTVLPELLKDFQKFQQIAVRELFLILKEYFKLLNQSDDELRHFYEMMTFELDQRVQDGEKKMEQLNGLDESRSVVSSCCSSPGQKRRERGVCSPPLCNERTSKVAEEYVQERVAKLLHQRQVLTSEIENKVTELEKENIRDGQREHPNADGSWFRHQLSEVKTWTLQRGIKTMELMRRRCELVAQRLHAHLAYLSDGKNAHSSVPSTLLKALDLPVGPFNHESYGGLQSDYYSMPALSDHSCAKTTCSLSPAKDTNDYYTVSVFPSRRPIDQELYFHGILPRREIELLLKQNGDFLVRESQDGAKSRYVLSTLWNNEFKHFRIAQTSQQSYFRIEGPSFETISELMAYYYKSKSPVTKMSGAILERAVHRESWQLRNDDVQLIEGLGEGSFGKVYRGVLRSTGEQVAVKTCHGFVSPLERRKFLAEGRLMRSLDHPNIVRLIGICAHQEPVMIVMELVRGGALREYLIRENQHIPLRTRIGFLLDCSLGMEYLEEHEVLHRDLAARNCLISGDRRTLKVADFGMARDVCVYAASVLDAIPVKWTAPEVFTDRTYSSLSDIWSFGVLIWEVFANGADPYANINNKDLCERILSGYRMTAPRGCPPIIAELMHRCWRVVAHERPHFKQIREELHTIISALADS